MKPLYVSYVICTNPQNICWIWKWAGFVIFAFHCFIQCSCFEINRRFFNWRLVSLFNTSCILASNPHKNFYIALISHRRAIVYSYTHKKKYYHFGCRMIIANTSNDLNTGKPPIDENIHTPKLQAAHTAIPTSTTFY